MANQIDIDQKGNHVGGSFQWEKRPKCCERLIVAVEEDKFIFVSNLVEGEGVDRYNMFYMTPVDHNGHLVRSKCVPITNCPWCGASIRGLKKYTQLTSEPENPEG